MISHANPGSPMSSLVPNLRMQPDCAGKASLPPACLLSLPYPLQTFPIALLPCSYVLNCPFPRRFDERARSLPVMVCCRLSTTTERLVLQHKRQRYAYKRERAALTPTYAWKDQPCISRIADSRY